MQKGLGKKGLGKKGLGKDDLGKKAFAPHACAGEAYLCAGVRDLLRPMRGACEAHASPLAAPSLLEAHQVVACGGEVE
jgi:hypothetical protein